MEISVLLHNVRSSHNVGSIFRTADAAGAGNIFLTGYTPTPKDRFGRKQKDIAKTALGAEEYIDWQYAKDPLSILKESKKEGWRIVGVEQDPRSNLYTELKLSGKVIFVFGNEVRGLSKQLREECDDLIEIPMKGQKESLNVSVAVGIVLFNALK